MLRYSEIYHLKLVSNVKEKNKKVRKEDVGMENLDL